MSREPRSSGFLERWGIVFGIWTLMSLLVATQTLFRLRATEDPVPWPRLVLFQLSYWYGWALLTPLILSIVRRLGTRRLRWTRLAPLHAAIGFVVSIVMMGWWSLLMHRIVGEGPTLGAVFQRYLLIGFHYDVLTYVAIVGAGFALNYRDLFRERAVRASQLETRLVQAQLDVLRMQLRPHFLFNTLHAIASLVEDDPRGARRMIALLSDLLRLTLDLGERQEISLREELEILGSYLEIESTRFQERLQFRRDVPDECLDALVPALLLQPLVENALRHGVDPRDFVSRVELKGRLAGDRLELEVRDHGLGMREDPGDGIGLANVRARLEQMYPGVGELVLSEPGDGGLRVIIRLPFVTTRGRRGAEG